jgi:Zn-finger nucleic acid-binding protein
VFADLARRAAQVGDTADPLLARLERASRTAPNRRRRGSFYRPCPTCGSLMPRRQYSHGSGVIIDLCKEHGVWFDADELPRLLRWIRTGGSVKDENESSRDTAPRASARSSRSRPAQDARDEPSPLAQVFVELVERGGLEIGEMLVRALAALFKK